MLEEAGKSFERNVDFDDLARNPGGIPLEPAMLTLNKVERNFAEEAQGSLPSPSDQ